MFRLQLIIGFILINFSLNSVIRLNDDDSNDGLYTESDKVLILNNENFERNVFNQSYATNVEFYNSFCGFCRRFAPVWIDHANDIYSWRDIVKVAAIDCAADENNDLCRQLEIMAYPTLRYFPPNYQNTTKNLGIKVEHLSMDAGRKSLVSLMMNETAPPISWPKLNPIEFQTKQELFNSLFPHVKYMFLVYEPNNLSITAQEIALDFNQLKEVEVRQIASISVAVNLGLSILSGLYVADRDRQTINTIPVIELNRSNTKKAINDYLISKGVQLPIIEQIPLPNTDDTSSSSPKVEEISAKDLVIVEHVKLNLGVVYQADLEGALRYSVFHELVKYNDMDEERITALKRYLSALQKYSPLGDNGQKFLNELNNYVTATDSFTGKELKDKIRTLETKHKPVFSSNHWIGCRNSVSGRRGFTCGLWTLFHYLTVQASISERANDPLEVLQAIHGFVKHFFGCTHCSEHFQEMANKNNIWNVSSKDEAILWLWSAHNEVNKRLAGDDTEDPAFPKVQFPTKEMCTECYRHDSENNSQNQWNHSEVLYYLKKMNSMFNISRFGVDDESVLTESFERLHAKQQIRSAFSEMDVRMGMLLYAFCMLIIVVAVKLFLRRGYRKKIYTHDFLGKF